MATPSDTLLSEFIDAWTSGRRPDVDAYLARADDSDRGTLEREIHTFLLHAPAPNYRDEARSAIRAQPLTRAISDMPGELGLWSALLPSLRKRARLRRDQLVTKLAEALGASHQERKVARYYHGMEAGTLDPAGVSSRVLAALARLLDISQGELEQAGAFRGFARSMPHAAFGRTYDSASGEPDAVPPMASPATEGATWDDIDELFRGGR